MTFRVKIKYNMLGIYKIKLFITTYPEYIYSIKIFILSFDSACLVSIYLIFNI